MIKPVAVFFQTLTRFFNPLIRLGSRQYSFLFPALSALSVYGVLEVMGALLHENFSAGGYTIFLTAAMIMFFAFRDGMLGGHAVLMVTVMYYAYIIFSRPEFDDPLVRQSALETTILLGVVFFILGGVIGWLKEKIDVLIEAEANEKRRLQAIIRQLPVGVLIADPQGNIVEMNSMVDELTDKNISIGFRVGRETILDAHTPQGEKVPPDKTPLARVLKDGETITAEEYVVDHRDGSRVHLQVSASPIHNRRGKMIAVAEILTDITQQKEIEKMKDDFLSIASHELKTPLTTIKGYTQVLERSEGFRNDSKARLYLEKTTRYVDRLAVLIEDLLDVSRIQSGKLEFKIEEYELIHLIQETIHGFQEISPTVTISLSAPQQVILQGDSSRMEQVITNLVSNAIKYSPGADRVDVEVIATSRTVSVAIRDYGIGIAADQIDKLFTRFFRVQGAAQQFSGLGIGLFISAQIVERMGGKITVKSQEGRGSTFTLRVPVHTKTQTL